MLGIKQLRKDVRRGLRLLEEILWWVRPHHHKAVTCRFAGAYWTDPKTGKEVTAVQQVPANTPLTGGFVFKDANQVQVPGPIGTITADNPAVTPTLSGDG